MFNFKGTCFPIDAILVCIRWEARYPPELPALLEMVRDGFMRWL